jgi:hypothetical protein
MSNALSVLGGLHMHAVKAIDPTALVAPLGHEWHDPALANEPALQV